MCARRQPRVRGRAARRGPRRGRAGPRRARRRPRARAGAQHCAQRPRPRARRRRACSAGRRAARRARAAPRTRAATASPCPRRRRRRSRCAPLCAGHTLACFSLAVVHAAAVSVVVVPLQRCCCCCLCWRLHRALVPLPPHGSFSSSLVLAPSRAASPLSPHTPGWSRTPHRAPVCCAGVSCHPRHRHRCCRRRRL